MRYGPLCSRKSKSHSSVCYTLGAKSGLVLCKQLQQLQPSSGTSSWDDIDPKICVWVDVQVATALARSAVNRTLAVPSAALNTMIYNPDPLETNDQGSQIGPQDPNFMHSFAWLDLTGETASKHLSMCTIHTQRPCIRIQHT